MTHAAAFPAPVVLWSKPEEERAGKPLLVLLHGYGANEEDLLSLADLLPRGIRGGLGARSDGFRAPASPGSR